MTETERAGRQGFSAAVAAFVLWGTLPLYFHLFGEASAAELLAHRVLWSVPALGALIIIMSKSKALLAVLSDRKSLATLLATTALIGGNWYIFTWAVMNDHIMQASLGYYINPLVNVLLGVVLLKEGLTVRQKIAIALAAAGVANQIFAVGQFPFIALALAFSFGGYGYLRKVVKADSITGLFIEVVLLAPLALIAIIWLGSSGQGYFIAGGAGITALLITTGPVTALPLTLFTIGARRLKLSTIGLLQYIAPSMQFGFAVAFGEPFTWAHAVTFGFIWAGLTVYSYDLWKRDSAARAQRRRDAADASAAASEPGAALRSAGRGEDRRPGVTTSCS